MTAHPGGAELPPPVRALVDGWIEQAGVEGHGAAVVRADLEEHFREGLAAGRTADELIEAFGDPGVTAPLLRASPPARAEPIPPGPRAGLDELISDVRMAARRLRAHPVHALTVVAVLALGIGANALSLTIVNEVLLEPLPVSDQASLVNVIAEIPGGNSFSGFSVADFEALSDGNDVLEGLIAYAGVRMSGGDDPERDQVIATLASPGYFEFLGVPAAIGRAEVPEWSGWGADDVVVLSHRFWLERMAGDPAVVGSTVRLNDVPLTVIGVAEEGFTGTFIGFPMDVWIPLGMAPAFQPDFDVEDRTQRFLELLGRRRAGVSVADADAGLDRVMAGLEAVYPVENRGVRVRVVELTGLDDSLRAGVLGFVGILVAVSALVLIVACTNVGGLLLVRTMARERELAIRIALGAGGARILRQTLTETVLLTLAGGAAAVLLAKWGAHSMERLLASLGSGLGVDLALDWRVLSLTGIVALCAALVAGATPGLHVLRKHPAGVLRRGPVDRGAGRARGALVVAQVAASVVLAVSAVLFARSLARGLAVDPGFDADRVAVLTVTLGDEGGGQDSPDLQRALLERLRGSSSLASAALATAAPVAVARTPVLVSVPGVESPPGQPGHTVDAHVVSSGYFAATGIEIVAGASLDALDDEDPTRYAVASLAFVDRFLAGRAPVGLSIDVDGVPTRILGVAEEVRYLVQDPTPDPLLYLSWSGRTAARMHVVLGIRAGSNRAAAAAGAREALRSIAPSLPPPVVRTVRDTLTDSMLPQRLGVILVGLMGALAIVLASLGLYGTVQQAVTSQSRALGVRLALGGRRVHVLVAVLRQAFGLVGLGILIGTGLALLLAPRLRPFLVDVAPSDPRTYLAVAIVFALVALCASAPALVRALRIDPARALRAD
jgi:predicted permease